MCPPMKIAEHRKIDHWLMRLDTGGSGLSYIRT